MIQKTTITVNSSMQSRIKLDSKAFPFACMYLDTSHLLMRKVPWHWHNILEIDYLEQGSKLYQLPIGPLELHSGDVLFINATVLHKSTALSEDCREYTMVFTPALMAGSVDSIFETRYIHPVLSSKLEHLVFRADRDEDRHVIQCARELVRLSKEEPPYYEFDTRSLLCEIWKEIFPRAAQIVPIKHAGPVDSARIKIMMDYIEQNYTRKLTVADIAASASIGERECSRCFGRCLDVTPIGYLTNCRLRISTELLTGSEQSVLEISEACGFSSPSYYTKVFHSHFGVTPLQYRKTQAAT